MPAARGMSEFVEILNDRDQVRERGFFVAVRGSSSLASLQAACGEQGWNHCFTARYRVRPARALDLLATVAHALVDDLQALLDGGPTRGDVRDAQSVGFARELLDALGPAVSADGDDVEESLAKVLRALEGGRSPESQKTGKTRTRKVGGDSLMRSGRRLVLFLELDPDPARGDADTQMADALRSARELRDCRLWKDLPLRVGLVASGLPAELLDPRAGDDARVRVVELPEAEAATRFKIGSALNDAPSASDELDRRRYAAALAQLLLHQDTVAPLTVGIHGRWGTGKSSFMEQLREELHRRGRSPNRLAEWLEAPATYRRRPPIATVWFNAWRYEDAEQIWAGLLTRVSAAIEEQAGSYWKLLTVTRLAIENSKRQLFWSGLLTLGLFVALSAVPHQITGAWGSIDVPEVLGSGLLPGLFLLQRLFTIARPASERIAQLARLPSGSDSLGYQHVVISHLDVLLSALERYDPGARVFVFIDDLDRCSDQQIMEILQAVILILARSSCFVVLGIDTRMIYRAVETHYTSDDASPPSDFAREYLKKIIQLSFHLPSIRDDARTALLRSLFSEGAQAGAAAAPGHGEAAPSPSPAPPSSEGPSHSSGAVAVDYELLWPVDDGAGASPARFVEDTPAELAAFADYRLCLEDNPREIKRVINIHRFMKYLVESSGLVGSGGWPEPRQRRMVRWVLFCAGWPRLVPGRPEDVPASADVVAAAIDAHAAGDLDPRLDVLRKLARPEDAISSDEIDDTFRFIARSMRLVEEDFARGGDGGKDVAGEGAAGEGGRPPDAPAQAR